MQLLNFFKFSTTKTELTFTFYTFKERTNFHCLNSKINDISLLSVRIFVQRLENTANFKKFTIKRNLRKDKRPETLSSLY